MNYKGRKTYPSDKVFFLP